MHRMRPTKRSPGRELVIRFREVCRRGRCKVITYGVDDVARAILESREGSGFGLSFSLFERS